MLITRFLILVFMLFSLTGAGEVWGQCTVTRTSNANYNLPAGNNNAVICVDINFSQTITLGANTGVTIRVLGTRTFSGNVTATNAYNIEVFGTIAGGNRAIVNGGVLTIFSGGQYGGTGNLTLTNGTLDIRNGGSISRPIIVNNSSTFLNAGTSSGTVTLNGTSTYNNSGTQSANVNLNNSAVYTIEPVGVQNGGTISLNSTSSVINNGTNSRQTNFASGTSYVNNGNHTGPISSAGNTIITNNGTFSGLSGNLDGRVNNSGTLTMNVGQINSSGVINNTGQITANGILRNDGNISSGLGTFNKTGGDFLNNGGKVIFGNGSSFSQNVVNDGTNGIFTINGTVNVSGIYSNRNGATTQAANSNQCNTLTVSGNIENNGSTITGNGFNYNGTGTALFLNKNRSSGNNYTNGAAVGTCTPQTCLQQIGPVITAGERSWIFIFRCSGTFSAPSLLTDEDFEEAAVLTVGGGGGGGFGGAAGGGGAGGYVFSDPVSFIPGTSYPVVVGRGGPGGQSNGLEGTNGLNSSALGVTAYGGGGGGSTTLLSFNGTNGGSGGGGASVGTSGNGNGGNGGIQQGFEGNSGINQGANASGGGGGGSESSGFQGSPNGSGRKGGQGGNGTSSSISGAILTYAGGGAGNAGNPGQSGGGSGGSGIGGSGGDEFPGGNGVQNTGSGGGAGSVNRGGSGSNGIVIIKISYKIQGVEMRQFNASYYSPIRAGELTWATAKEWENSHFEIERSVNDANSWIKIGEVTGKGYSDLPVGYAFNDPNLPASGGNIFYRLKQVDLTGNFAYSVTRAIQVEGLDGSTSWIAYPNPSALGTSISVDLLDRSEVSDESILIRISDARGVFESYSVSRPEEVSAVVNSYLGQARPGMHILQLIWGNKSEQLKLIRK